MNTGTTTDALSRAMVQALALRRPGAVILDEAEHLLEVSGGKKFLQHLKVIRSIANRTGIPHILVGTYELLDFMDFNATLRRRSKKVHMPRYDAESKEDQRAFNLVVSKFQDKLPCSCDLLAHSDYLFEGSIGCVGLLKVWLSGAVSAVLRENREAMTLEDLKNHALPPNDLCLILGDAVKGEAHLMADPNAWEMVQAMLRPTKANKDAQARKAADDAKRIAKKGNRAPGERAPARDPVGVPDYESVPA
jgi:hypothetical protein